MKYFPSGFRLRPGLSDLERVFFEHVLTRVEELAVVIQLIAFVTCKADFVVLVFVVILR